MGSEPYDAITERITNSMDAMIELNVELNPSLKTAKDPRTAIEQIYKIREGNLRYIPPKEVGVLASNINLLFLDGDDVKKPTIEIMDKGIGQHPDDFSQTLLGLNRDYKVSKFYLIGAFGQGGQTSFANCEYGLIISRKDPKLLQKGQMDEVGWSIVRYRDPTTETQFYKIGYYEYCIEAKTNKIPIIDPKLLDFAFERGTIIRLISYSLPKGSSDAIQAEGTAWHYLSQSLFDSLLPIRVFEGRKRYENRNRPMTGLASRLWKGGKEKKVKIEINNQYNVNLGQYGEIIINYWCLKPIADPKEKINWRDIKKGYVSSNSAIFVTLNGQRHGVETSNFLRDKANLTFSYDYIIIQVDCDNLENTAKKTLVTSTRERLKEGPMKDILFEEVANILKNDVNIARFEKERKDAILTATTFKETSNIRKLVGKYIAQNDELKELQVMFKRERQEKIISETVKKEEKEDIEKIDITELIIPELKNIPTYLKILNRKNPIPIEKGGSAVIRLETDVDDQYLDGEKFERLRCIHQKNMTKFKSHSKLRNGKISYQIFCPSSKRIGSKEILCFELKIDDKPSLFAEREIICVEPQNRKKEQKETNIPEPKIIAISKKDSQWNERGYDDKCVGEIFLDGRENSAIIVSIDNIHLQNTIKKMKESLVGITQERYVAAIAYYLLLKRVNEIKKGTNPNESQETGEDPKSSSELQRLANTISLLIRPIDLL